jgi:hypothetical protein
LTGRVIAPRGSTGEKLTKARIVHGRRIECFREPLESDPVELEEETIQENRLCLAGSRVQHELGAILPDGLGGAIDQREARFIGSRRSALVRVALARLVLSA